MLQLIPENVRDSGSDIVFVAAVIAAVVAIVRSPVGKPLRFAWQRLFVEPRDERRAAVVARHVEPLITASRQASLAQHEEQNRNHADLVEKVVALDKRFDGLDEAVGEHGRQLEAGARVMKRLRVDVNKALHHTVDDEKE